MNLFLSYPSYPTFALQNCQDQFYFNQPQPIHSQGYFHNSHPVFAQQLPFQTMLDQNQQQQYFNFQQNTENEKTQLQQTASLYHLRSQQIQQDCISERDNLGQVLLKERVNCKGHWSKEEHYKFLQFIRQHQALFKDKCNKKSNRIFKLMSEEITTRTACQCRSHYLKFNPFEETNIARRKLSNNEEVYFKLFNERQQI